MPRSLLFLFLVSISFKVAAQDSLASEKAMMHWLSGQQTGRYFFQSPGKEFSLTPDSSGYAWEEKHAALSYAIFPFPFDETVRDYKKVKSNAEYIMVDTFSKTWQNKHVFISVQEAVAPAGSGYENFTMLFVILPHSKHEVVILSGVYPKSMDAVWRQKLIDAALTIRKL